MTEWESLRFYPAQIHEADPITHFSSYFFSFGHPLQGLSFLQHFFLLMILLQVMTANGQCTCDPVSGAGEDSLSTA